MLDVYAAEVHFPIPLNAPFDDFPASYQAGWGSYGSNKNDV